ncbi:MAG: hypothetical protein ACI89J_004342 [Hyphomicrobiaceae bacterium]|jgi:hypothetical protein
MILRVGTGTYSKQIGVELPTTSAAARWASLVNALFVIGRWRTEEVRDWKHVRIPVIVSQRSELLQL